MSGARIFHFDPRKGIDDRGSRPEAGPEGSAWEARSRRSPVVTIELSPVDWRESTSKVRDRLDRAPVEPPLHDRHPFNAYSDGVSEPLGLMLTGLGYGAVIAGTALAMAVLAGVL